MQILFNCADIYISLHRSEGSGLTIMEAINLEIPTVTTNYSGNLDFCDENCSLVDYKPTLVDAKHPAYREIVNKTTWAEPNVDDAVKKLFDI
jgi:glycosyltransferase involved in cell wall biosynthesis